MVAVAVALLTMIDVMRKEEKEKDVLWGETHSAIAIQCTAARCQVSVARCQLPGVKRQVPALVTWAGI